MGFKVGIHFKDGRELLLEEVGMSCINAECGQLVMYSVMKLDGAQVDIPVNNILYVSFSKERREMRDKELGIDKT